MSKGRTHHHPCSSDPTLVSSLRRSQFMYHRALALYVHMAGQVCEGKLQQHAQAESLDVPSPSATVLRSSVEWLPMLTTLVCRGKGAETGGMRKSPLIGAVSIDTLRGGLSSCMHSTCVVPACREPFTKRAGVLMRLSEAPMCTQGMCSAMRKLLLFRLVARRWGKTCGRFATPEG